MEVNNFIQEDGKVTVLMLVSSVNVIGKVHHRDEKRIWLTQPLAWGASPIPGEQGQYRLQMSSYLVPVTAFNKDEPFPFKLEHVMHELLPAESLADPYLKATSGIVLARADAIPQK